MQFITGEMKRETVLPGSIGKSVTIQGCIHKIRKMSGFSFIILRTKSELIQCVAEDTADLAEGAWVTLSGTVKEDARAINGYEVSINEVEVLVSPSVAFPITINKKNLDITLNKNLDHRIIALRHPKERAIFKIQQILLKGFREFLENNNFTEIKSPKLVSGSAEGGANVFKLDYFGKEALLAQSPQFYKEIMVGVFEKVFEVGPVFRAEKHDTSRHVNEYTSLDIEVGFIDSFYDIMNVEAKLLNHMFNRVALEGKKELSLLGIDLSSVGDIPSITFHRAKEILSEQLKASEVGENDLKPLEEKIICRYIKEQYNSDFVFITHYPTVKRPFYTMDNPEDISVTESFDLLYKGLEITTGGQRIHDFTVLINKIKQLGMNPSNFESFTQLHKYGIPPHGGFGMGLERLTARLLNLENVKQACLFPRDINRITP